jgi:general secretion pathway protein N
LQKSPRLLAIAGVASFIVFLMVLLPARVLTGFVGSDLARFSGVDGSIWNGRVETVVVSGLQFSRVRWSLHPLQIFIGRLALTFETQFSGGAVSGAVALGINGSVRLRDFEASGPIETIAGRLRLPAAGGRFIARIEKLDIDNQWPSAFVGEVRVGDVPLNLIGVSSGWSGSYAVNFNAETIPDDGGFVGAIVDQGGPIAISGSLALRPPANYDLVAKVKAREDAPPELEQGLMLLGTADAGGNRELRLSGSL